VARYLVSGCDVWLNTPLRPREASGTSGMKAAANGVLNCSTLDGWWCEAYEPNSEVGWAIGRGEEYSDGGYQDEVEAGALYNLLEKEIVPLFYDRGPDNLPRRWISRMKASIGQISPVFNTHRMVAEYAEGLYFPAARRATALAADGFARAKTLAAWKDRARAAWSDVRVLDIAAPDGDQLPVGCDLKVKAKVQLGRLSPDDVCVELYQGRVNEHMEIADAQAIRMGYTGESAGSGVFEFAGAIPCRSSGQHGFAVRVIPSHSDLANPFEMGLITWS
jgi:starch phosphorylase